MLAAPPEPARMRALPILTLLTVAALAAPSARGTFKITPVKGEAEPANFVVRAAVTSLEVDPQGKTSNLRLALFDKAGGSDPAGAPLRLVLTFAGPPEKPEGFSSGSVDFKPRGYLNNYYQSPPRPRTAQGCPLTNKTGSLLVSGWKYTEKSLSCTLVLNDEKDFQKFVLRYAMNVEVNAALK